MKYNIVYGNILAIILCYAYIIVQVGIKLLSSMYNNSKIALMVKYVCGWVPEKCVACL